MFYERDVAVRQEQIKDDVRRRQQLHLLKRSGRSLRRRPGLRSLPVVLIARLQEAAVALRCHWQSLRSFSS